MANKIIITITILILSILAVLFMWLWAFKPVEQQQSTNQSNSSADNQDNTNAYKEYASEKGVKLRLYQPVSGANVNSPLEIKGEVPGNWSFEATFPIKLVNTQQDVIATAIAKLSGDWMTDAYVPFTATLTFDKPTATSGFLVLQKDNPSAQADKDDSATIEVKF